MAVKTISPLLSFRDNRHLSQAEAAELLHLDLSTYGRIERGRQLPRKENALHIAKTCKCSVSALYAFYLAKTKTRARARRAA